MGKKNISLIGKDVIGIDEFNNGFSLHENGEEKFPMVFCGYLIKDYQHSCCGNEMYEKKGKIFSKNGCSIERVLERSRYYLSRNPSFFYGVITKNELKGKAPKIRAEIMAAITLKFFLNYELEQTKTAIVLDKINELGYCGEVVHFYLDFLGSAGLSIPVKVQEHGDKYNYAVKKADRVAYYLSALKYTGKRNKWPLPHKKTSIKELSELTILVKNPDFF
jgi:hypothetical protein